MLCGWKALAVIEPAAMPAITISRNVCPSGSAGKKTSAGAPKKTPPAAMFHM